MSDQDIGPDLSNGTMTVAQISGVTIYVTCKCGNRTCHEIDCAQDDYGVWHVETPDRFILCETCTTLIDAGLHLTVDTPA